MTKLEAIYNQKVNTPSDINEHLPTLKAYAEKCDHVTEMGVRYAVSTYALMMGAPKKMISIDIMPLEHFGVTTQSVYDIAEENNIDYKFVLGDTLAIEIEPTELLFIDTLHNYNQLKKELELHAGKVSKYIIFHDTTSFGFIGEQYVQAGFVQGLWPAIEEFLQANPEWKILERYTNNNGLTVIEKAL
jgi:hypothetical protein